MTGLALYLKYRPLDFDQLVGQEAVTRTLKNALRQGRIRHAYLFTGPRGTGKTTTARILSKAINCLAPEDQRPCNACHLCQAINEGRLMDLIEIDAASNRGIDEIRDIREKARFLPNEGRFKIYVLDEAHMLTDPAFNALLKTLEEPPPHVVFALVTTEPQKIPATIASRCQRFDFRRIALNAIIERLSYIAAQEGVHVDRPALELIARQGTGAMRDAISLLDQLASYGEEISLELVQMVIGHVPGEAAADLVKSLVNGDLAAGLGQINHTVEAGTDPRQLGEEVIEYLRRLLLIQQGAGTSALSLTSEQAGEMEDLAGQVSLERLLLAIQLFSGATTDLKRRLQTIPQLPLEMAFVECLLRRPEAGSSNHSGLDLRQPSNAVRSPSSAAPQVALREVAELVSLPEASEDETRTDPAVVEGAVPVPHPPSGPLSLEMVEQSWDNILQAVRRRNPTAEGALRTGCKAVEVSDGEIVITFPFPFLRDKLGDPRRKAEIQNALSEVLNLKCRLTLMLASEYTPSEHVPHQVHAPQRPAEILDDSALEQIEQWAQERGGKATMIGPALGDDGS